MKFDKLFLAVAFLMPVSAFASRGELSDVQAHALAERANRQVAEARSFYGVSESRLGQRPSATATQKGQANCAYMTAKVLSTGSSGIGAPAPKGRSSAEGLASLN